MATTALSSGISVQPVELVVEQTCRYKAHPCQHCGKAKSNRVHKKDGGECTFKRKNGCANCGKPKKDRSHFGAPPSLNILGSGNAGAFMGLKTNWQELFADLLRDSDLPTGLERVTVEGFVTFGVPNPRDEGNIRFLIEKALGDALVEGGWIPDDTFFPVRHYSFGNLEGEYVPNRSALRLMLFPTLRGDELTDDPWLQTDDGIGGAGLGVDVEIAGGDAEHDGVGRVAGPEQLTQLG